LPDDSEKQHPAEPVIAVVVAALILVVIVWLSGLIKP
jgi:hypothetical protein